MVRTITILAFTMLLAGLACTPHTTDGDADADTDVDVDADADADADSGCDPAAQCCNDFDCSDQIFCNGIERCDRGVCESGPPIDCDDGLACTTDECDEASNRCVHRPVHAVCDDGDLCNGEERCVPSATHADEDGCVPGTPLRCDDGDPCTDDYCEDGECRTRIRDSDGDGYGDWNCTVCTAPGVCERGDDCDDSDPTVHPGAEEICGDGKDNNCDRIRDYADPDCVVPNDTCATALPLVDGVTVYGSTRGTTADIARSCGAPSDLDVAFSFTLPAGRDVVVRVGSGSRAVSVSLTPDCGVADADLLCTTGRDAELVARGLVPGVYFVVVSVAGEADFTVDLSLPAAAPVAEADICATAAPIATDGSVETVDLTGLLHDYEMPCLPGGDLYDAVYTIEVGATLGLDLTAASVSGAGTVALALEDRCGLASSARGCWTGEGSVAGRVWRLAPGTYYLLVGHDEEAPVNVTAHLVDVGAGIYLWEDFTTDPTGSGWTLGGVNWQHGTPTTPAPDDGPCIGTVMAGTYPNNMTYAGDYAETPPIVLAGGGAPELRFRSWMDTESCCDGGHIEISVDGGAFALLNNATMTPPYDATIGGVLAWRGTRTTWADHSVSLADYIGRTVRLRFAFRSDGSVVRQGWYVDSVRVLEP